LTAAVLIATAAGAGLTPCPASAQSLEAVTATPESAAELFLRSVRAIRWGAAAQLIHDETLDRFGTIVTMMSDADATGDVRRSLVDTDSAGLAALPRTEVFDRAIGALIDGMPGLMHALYDRDDEMLGYVMEGADMAHAVYRTMARISGAVPEVKVMQLRHSAGGWRVHWSDELAVLDAALRGFGR
jgi:hypothetical protein